MFKIDVNKLETLKKEERDLLNFFDSGNKNFFYIKVAICHWHDKNGLHMRKDIRVLSKKSGKYWMSWFDEDCSNSGADYMYKNFKDLEEGVYKVTMKTFTDCENGYVYDWKYITEKL